MYWTKLASIQLLQWNTLLEYNEDPLTVFSKVQLDPSLMYEPGARYTEGKIADLWREMEKTIKDPCFGLGAAKGWHPSNFGTLGYALLMSTSLRITLERLIRFHRYISDAPVGELSEQREAGKLVFNLIYTDGEHYSPAREDTVLAWLISVLRMNFQRSLAPVAVSFTHSRPDCAGRYYELFQSPIHFDAPVCGVELSLDDVDKILPSANKDLAAFSDQAMTQYLSTENIDDLVSQVVKIIVEHLPSGDATIDNVASELFCSTRKLQRLLQEEGTSFMALLNQTRKDIAKQYVQDKKMELVEISYLLGFSEQSAFSRSFKRWTGKSPSSYRKVF